MKKTLDEEKQIQKILIELGQIKSNSSQKEIDKILEGVRKQLVSLNA
jgi:hypothetical protein